MGGTEGGGGGICSPSESTRVAERPCVRNFDQLRSEVSASEHRIAFFGLGCPLISNANLDSWERKYGCSPYLYQFIMFPIWVVSLRAND